MIILYYYLAMKMLLLASQKGGAGKSTLARAFAVAALRNGLRTALIDADPQGSVKKWAQRRDAQAPTVLDLDGQGLPQALADAKERGAQLAIVDSPPHDHALVSLAAENASAILIPVRPFPDDLEAIGATVKIAHAVGRKSAILINAAPARAQALNLARAALATFDIPLCPHAIIDRVVHPYSTGAGMTAQEFEPESKGAAEIEAAWRWVGRALKL
jgi:chromosome partitioning protein